MIVPRFSGQTLAEWNIIITIMVGASGKNRDDVAARPFLKWVGGKRQLLDEISRYYPFADCQITKYAEPFVGGGAVLFDILNKYQLSAVYISDINWALINTYLAVRDYPQELVARLSQLQGEFLPLTPDRRKLYYNMQRGVFNEWLAASSNTHCDVTAASLMIFLNKTCFNGLYRVNKKGLFNVPVGSYKSPIICDADNILLASERLKGVAIVCGDYRESGEFIDDHTFAYFDPPYRPINRTSSFTSYTDQGFGDLAQIELADFINKMSAKGARIVLSNSDPKNVDTNDNFFEEIYRAHKIARVAAKRMINCKGAGRGQIGELLISNFGV